MKRMIHALTALALLPALVSVAPLPPAPAPAPVVQACHYEAEIAGTHTRSDGVTIVVPIGRIEVTTCTSPEDLARRVEELTATVRTQATAQALDAGRVP